MIATVLDLPPADAATQPTITLAPVEMRLIETWRSLPIDLVTAILAYDTSEIALLHAVGGVSAASLLAEIVTLEGEQP